MKIAIYHSIKIPLTPNFIHVKSGERFILLPLSEFTDEQIDEIGKAMIADMKLKSKTKKYYNGQRTN